MIGWNFVNFFEMKDKKDKQCRFIFTAAFGHIYQGCQYSGGHCIQVVCGLQWGERTYG